MPQQERRERMQRLLAHIKHYDLAYWTRHVLSQFADLTAAARAAKPRRPNQEKMTC